MTESLDFMEALHDAICDSRYKSKSKHPKAMAQDLWNAIRDDRIDLAEAVMNVAYEQFMDAAIGKANQKTADAHQQAMDALGLRRSPVGIQSRANWAQKAGGYGPPLKDVQKQLARSRKPGAPANCDDNVTRAAIKHYVSTIPAMRSL